MVAFRTLNPNRSGLQWVPNLPSVPDVDATTSVTPTSATHDPVPLRDPVTDPPPGSDPDALLEPETKTNVSESHEEIGENSPKGREGQLVGYMNKKKFSLRFK